MPFVKGVSGNPSGRPKLSPEIKEMKEASLAKAIKLLHDKITDDKFMQGLEPKDFLCFIEMAFDRFGLPKVTKSEHTGADGEPLGSLVSIYLTPDEEREIDSRLEQALERENIQKSRDMEFAPSDN